MELLLLGLGILIIIGLAVVIVQNALIKVHTDTLVTIEKQCINIEGYLRDLTNDMGFGEPPPMYQSEDGKYSAHSLNELIQKMESDKNISPEELEDIRNFFEKDARPFEDDDDEDEEEGWKKGK